MFKLYLNMKDGEPRPYATAIRPSKERIAAVIAGGGKMFEVDVEIPGFEWTEGKVTAAAKPMKVD